MILTADEHALVDKLCCDREARNSVFEHLVIGIMQSRVDGKYVYRNLENFLAEYNRLNEGADW